MHLITVFYLTVSLHWKLGLSAKRLYFKSLISGQVCCVGIQIPIMFGGWQQPFSMDERAEEACWPLSTTTIFPHHTATSLTLRAISGLFPGVAIIQCAVNYTCLLLKRNPMIKVLWNPKGHLLLLTSDWMFLNLGLSDILDVKNNISSVYILCLIIWHRHVPSHNRK